MITSGNGEGYVINAVGLSVGLCLSVGNIVENVHEMCKIDRKWVVADIIQV